MRPLTVKEILLIALAASLLFCAKPAQEKSGSTNPAISVDLLFEKDGCKGFRFEDGGRNHYFTNCQGSVSASWREYCGKNCYHTVSEEIQTNNHK